MPTAITRGAASASGFGFCANAKQNLSQYIYFYGNTYSSGGFGSSYVVDYSTNTFTSNSSNLAWNLQGSSSTGSTIRTYGFTNNKILIPLGSTYLEVYYYVTSKRSNGSVNGGDIYFGFGTTTTNLSQLSSDQSSAIIAGGQPNFYIATIPLGANVAGGSYYFTGEAARWNGLLWIRKNRKRSLN